MNPIKVLDFFSSSKSVIAETSDEDPREERNSDQRPCNETGHDWPDWEDDVFSLRASTVGVREKNRIKIQTGLDRRCTKCGKYDTKKKTLGYVRYEDGELVVE